MTEIPQWPVSKYKQTGTKIAAAKTKERERLRKQAEMPKSQCTPHKLQSERESLQPNTEKLKNYKHNAKVHYS